MPINNQEIPMIKRAKSAGLILAVVLLAGCASSGPKFSMAMANQVKNGMTPEQVIEIMRTNPTLVSDQGKVMVWSHAQANGLTGSTNSMAVKFSFDANGKTYGIPDGGVYGGAAKYQ